MAPSSLRSSTFSGKLCARSPRHCEARRGVPRSIPTTWRIKPKMVTTILSWAKAPRLRWKLSSLLAQRNHQNKLSWSTSLGMWRTGVQPQSFIQRSRKFVGRRNKLWAAEKWNRTTSSTHVYLGSDATTPSGRDGGYHGCLHPDYQRPCYCACP